MRKRKMSRFGSKFFALAMSAVLAAGTTLPVSAAKKSEDRDDKSETVYVNAHANGSVKDITVSDWLQNRDKTQLLEDESNLSKIKNVKGDEKFTTDEDNGLVWQADGKDIYYQGKSTEELPVSMSITYYLNGKQIDPKDLAGKSGDVKMRFNYTNNTKNEVKVDGKKVNVQTPFSMITTMILPDDTFSNIKVTNGKVVSDGDKSIVMGVVFPGLKDSLKLSDYEKTEDVDIPEYFEVTAKAKKFELDLTATVATTGTLSDLDTSKLDDADDLKDDIDDLTDAADKLVDGSGDLSDGAKDLNDAIHKYVDGVGTAADGSKKLAKGLDTLESNNKKLNKGAKQLSDGTKTLKSGTKQLKDGLKNYTSGASTLSTGISSAKGGVMKLDVGADQLQSGLKDYTDGVKKLSDGIDQMNKELDKVQIPSDAELKELQKIAKSLKADQKAIAANQKEIQGLLQLAQNFEKSKAQLTQDVATELTSGDTNTKLRGNIAAAAGDGAKVGYAQGYTDGAAKGAEVAAQQAQAVAAEEITKAVESGKISSAQAAALKEALSGVASKAGKKTQEALQASTPSPDTDKLNQQVTKAVVKDKNADPTQTMTDFGGFLQKEVDSAIPADSIQKLQALLPYLSDIKTQTDKLAAYSDAHPINLDDLSAKIDKLTKGVDTMDAGSKELVKNSSKLNGGMKTLNEGIATLGTGMSTLQAGSNTLVSNNDKLNSGASALDTGVGKLKTGSSQLKTGLKKYTDGVSTASDGAYSLVAGMDKLTSAGGLLGDGSKSLLDGANELHDGMTKFNEEGISKIADLAGDDLQTVIRHVKAVRKADQNYQTFSGIKDGQKGNVKFIIETDEISKDDD
ncbi:MAG: hypothetical protein U0K57_06415 [Lachnospiraceae bacterium]|nr:hypothetical protein [Lachnospiraceae bacterium]